MSLLYFLLAALWFVKVLSNQWPEGTTNNLLRSIKIDNSHSSTRYFRLHDIEYDPETGDYFYLGYFYLSINFHFISRFNYTGEHRWGKVFTNYSAYNTLEYSPTYQTLYYLIDTRPLTLMKVNSSSGEHIFSYRLPTSYNYDDYGDCSLSRDELAMFWLLYISTSKAMIRLNATTSEITYVQL